MPPIITVAFCSAACIGKLYPYLGRNAAARCLLLGSLGSGKKQKDDAEKQADKSRKQRKNSHGCLLVPEMKAVYRKQTVLLLSWRDSHSHLNFQHWIKSINAVASSSVLSFAV